MACKIIKYQIIVLIVILIVSISNTNVYAEYIAVYGRNAREIQFPIGENYYLDNGEKISTDTPAYLTDQGVAMIPLRLTLKLFGVDDSEITWNEKTKSVNIGNGDSITTFIANRRNAIRYDVPLNYDSYWWGKSDSCSNEIRVIGGKSVFYVPIRAFGALFGFYMSWNEETRSAIFNEGYKYIDYEIESPLELSGSDPYFVVFNWLFEHNPGLNFGIKYISVDMTDAKSDDYSGFIALMKSFCAKNGYTLLEDTYDGLLEKGLIKSSVEYPDYRYFENGILITFQDISYSKNRIVTNARKWQGPDGAFGGNLTLEKQDVWTITENNRVWVS